MNWKKIRLYAGITLAMCFWAFSFIWYKVAFRHLDPIALVFFRLITASVFLSLLLWLRGKPEKIQKKDFKSFLLMAFFEPFLYFLAESYGMTMVSSTTGAVIIAFIPLLTPVAAFFFFRERLSWLNIAGIFISFGGVLLVLTDKNFRLQEPAIGVVLMFLAVLSVISYTGVIVYLAGKYRPLTIILLQNIIGAAFFLPLFLVFELKETISMQWSWEIIAPVIKLGVFPSALAFVLFTAAIRDIGIVRANIFTNLIPVFAAILAFIILGEEMPAGKIAGIFVVLAGVLISQRNRIRSLQP